MKVFAKLFLGLSLIISVSCSKNQTKPATEFSREYQVGAYLWVQTSGEFKALCYQAYNLAKLRLDRDLEDKHNRKRAVVFDIDETVLDNSFGGAYELKNKLDWDRDSFNSWVELKKAEAIPGAREFIVYAISKRVEVIYISNRSNAQKESTIINFNRLGIPIKKENLYFMDNEWSKEKRRELVLSKYDVVLYFGDSLADFDKAWDNKKSKERNALVDNYRNDFGQKFIILPNPLYGEWENSLPKFKNRTELLKSIP